MKRDKSTGLYLLTEDEFGELMETLGGDRDEQESDSFER